MHIDLRGRWIFTRTIHHAQGEVNLVDGAASFQKSADGLIYDEVGVLRIQEREFRAERRYIWREIAGGYAVSFEDGSPFHEFHFSNPQATHFCRPDHYEVHYHFDNERWDCEWRVQGPRKDYVMKTWYER